MAQSINFGNDTYLDASAIVGVKGTLSGSDSIDDLCYQYHSGAYYCSNTTNTPGTYGMLIVLSHSTTGSTAQQIFLSSTGWIYKRYRTNSAWNTWYRFQGFEYNASGINYQYPKTYSFTLNANSTSTIQFESGARGRVMALSPYTALKAEYIFYAESDGNVRTAATCTGTGIAVATSSSGLAVTNSANNACNITVELYNGTITSVS